MYNTTAASNVGNSKTFSFALSFLFFAHTVHKQDLEAAWKCVSACTSVCPLICPCLCAEGILNVGYKPWRRRKAEKSNYSTTIYEERRG